MYEGPAAVQHRLWPAHAAALAAEPHAPPCLRPLPLPTLVYPSQPVLSTSSTHARPTPATSSHDRPEHRVYTCTWAGLHSFHSSAFLIAAEYSAVPQYLSAVTPVGSIDEQERPSGRIKGQLGFLSTNQRRPAKAPPSRLSDFNRWIAESLPTDQLVLYERNRTSRENDEFIVDSRGKSYLVASQSYENHITNCTSSDIRDNRFGNKRIRTSQ